MFKNYSTFEGLHLTPGPGAFFQPGGWSPLRRVLKKPLLLTSNPSCKYFPRHFVLDLKFDLKSGAVVVCGLFSLKKTFCSSFLFCHLMDGNQADDLFHVCTVSPQPPPTVVSAVPMPAVGRLLSPGDHRS